MNKRNQYTVMVETKEIRKFCVVASSVEEAAELMCNVVANTDILQTDLSKDSEVFTPKLQLMAKTKMMLQNYTYTVLVSTARMTRQRSAE